MLSLAQAAAKRGNSGKPLPGMWPMLAQREAFINRSELTLIVAPPSAGKSLFMMNYVVRAAVPTLAFFLDSDNLTVASRFGSILSGDKFADVKGDIDAYAGMLGQMENTQLAFRAEDLDEIRLQGEAFEQRYGVYPSLVIVDNLGNFTSGMAEEWPMLKALTLELNNLAHEWECAVVAAHHMTDIVTTKPLPRDKTLGKVSQYPRLMLSIGFDEVTWEYQIAIVKNSSGQSDPRAVNPITMWADTARMALVEYDPNWSPSSSMTVVSGWDGYPSASGAWSDL